MRSSSVEQPLLARPRRAAARGSSSSASSSTPARSASDSSADWKSSPSVSITNLKTSPPSPQPKQW